MCVRTSARVQKNSKEGFAGTGMSLTEPGPGTGKKTPGGAGTHTGHTGHTGARGHTDHTDEPHNYRYRNCTQYRYARSWALLLYGLSLRRRHGAAAHGIFR